uniref:CAZy families GH10 protein n=1 Tax=uncultured Opitutus sp. TaxID=296825 RepID=A0A060BYT6_9BACT|nr:CAZy families GH10 protein [uncultured Opitutus sp.]
MPDRKSEVLKPFAEKRDYMEDRIRAGIEQNRKGYATLKFVDKAGNPVTGVHAEIEQKTHDFQFGCSIFLLDEMETDEKNQGYKEVFSSAFNTAVAPFYWADLEPEKGRPRYAADTPQGLPQTFSRSGDGFLPRK